jgi:polyisoprenoid-binding protein YceI
VTLNGELIGVVTDPWGNERAGFNAKGIINRKDFGVNFNKVMDNGGVVVGDEVTIILDIEGIKTNEPIDHDKHQH